jgi:hypothetical protein
LIGPFDDVTAYMSTIPRGVFKDLNAHLEHQNVIPITPFSIESVTPSPVPDILSPHLGADRHNQRFLLIAKGMRIVGADSLYQFRSHSGQASGHSKLIPK